MGIAVYIKPGVSTTKAGILCLYCMYIVSILYSSCV